MRTYITLLIALVVIGCSNEPAPAPKPDPLSIWKTVYTIKRGTSVGTPGWLCREALYHFYDRHDREGNKILCFRKSCGRGDLYDCGMKTLPESIPVQIVAIDSMDSDTVQIRVADDAGWWAGDWWTRKDYLTPAVK